MAVPQQQVAHQVFALNVPEVKPRVRPPTAVSFHELDPSEVMATGARTWYVRTENMVVAYTEGPPGTTLVRRDQRDEYAVLVPRSGTEVEVSASGTTIATAGRASIVVPPGDSVLRLRAEGGLARAFTVASAPDLAERAVNAGIYTWPDNFLPKFRPWAPPLDGHRLRAYSLQEEPDGEHDSWNRVFASSTILTNWVDPIEDMDICLRNGERRRMSVHHHTDIDQAVLVTHGRFRVHLRVPWTADPADWCPEQHIELTAPAFVSVPPQVTHAFAAIGRGSVIDLFCPPRPDYAQLASCRNREQYSPPAGNGEVKG